MDAGILKAIRSNRLTVTDHDTGVIVAATAGFLRMVGAGENTAADGQTERLGIAMGAKVLRVEARLAAGSRSMTFALYVNGSLSGTASASSTVDTTTSAVTFRHPGLASDLVRVSIRYTGLMAGDRLYARVTWRG